MSIIRQDSKITIKRSTTPGVVPTVPTSSDFTDGTWSSTDLAVGEMFINTADDRIWIRSSGSILELDVSGSSGANTYVASASFLGTTLTLERNDGGIIQTKLEEYDYLLLKPSYTASGAEVVGSIYFESEDNTFNAVMDTDVIQQIGEEIYFRVQNNTGITIPNGTPLAYASSIGNSGNIRVTPMTASADTVPMFFVGIATQDIADGETGLSTMFGNVRGFQTNGANYGETWNNGDVIYIGTGSQSASGSLTNVQPNAPIPAIPVAVVISAHGSNGTIKTRPTYPLRLTELIDVNGTPLTENGQLPIWDNTHGYFDFTDNINNYNTEAIADKFGNFTGFPNRDDSEITYAGDVVSISPVSASTYTYYIFGKEYTSTGETFTIPNINYKSYFLYYDATGSFQTSETPWDILTTAPIAYVYMSNDTDNAMVFEERHSSKRNLNAHLEFHEQVGTYYVSGLNISDYTLQPSSPTDSDNQYSLSEGVIADEDLRSTIQAITGGSSLYTIARREGTTPDWVISQDGLPYENQTSGYIFYNENSGGSYTQTELANNEYVCYYVFAIPISQDQQTNTHPGYQIVNIPSTTVHSNLVDAQAETVSDNDFTNFAFQEICPLYKIIYKTSASYTNTGKCRIADVQRIQGTKVNITTQGSWTNNHSALSNLLADDHPQYLKNSLTSSMSVATASYSDYAVTASYAINASSSYTISGSELADIVELDIDNIVYTTGSQTLTGAKTFANNVTIIGDLFVSGSQVSVSASQMLVSDNTITVNAGESGSGVTNGIAGIIVDRGTATDYEFIFDETTDTFRIGESGSSQAVATRGDSPAAASIPYWNGTTFKYDDTSALYYSAATLFAPQITIDNAADANFTLDRGSTSNSSTMVFKTAGTETNGAWAIRMSGIGTATSLKLQEWTGTDTSRLELLGNGAGVKVMNSYTLPTTDGSANQVITTNGSGSLSWTDMASGSATTYLPGQYLATRLIDNTADSTVSYTVHYNGNSPSNTMRLVNWTLSDSSVVSGSITFTTPDFGSNLVNVDIEVDLLWNDEGGTTETWLGLHSSSADTTTPAYGWYELSKDSEAAYRDYEKVTFRMSGLSSNTEYTAYLHAISTGTTSVIYTGRQGQGAWSNNDLARPVYFKAIYVDNYAE